MKAIGLPDETRISRVQLRTAGLQRSLEFYHGILGFALVNKTNTEAALSVAANAPALLVLSEDRNAPPHPMRATGLYHVAFRYPSRKNLAQAFLRLGHHKYPIEGASDHIVSEALYLSDPEGNGVELYADRPRTQWVWRDGQISMSTEALDLENLLSTVDSGSPLAPMPPQMDIGHIHLHVANLEAAERFYHEFLGLSVTQRGYPGALFLSAGGYHHHIAVNTWAGGAAAPKDGAGLISYRLEVPIKEILYCLQNRAPLNGYEARGIKGDNGQDLVQIRDPNGNWLEVHAGT